MGLISYKLGQASIVLRVKIYANNVSTGGGLTGLTSASSGLKIGTIANNESATTVYTVAGSTIETISTLGTYAAPTATKCRFKEVDATNHPGVYEVQIADARFAVTSAKSILVSITGATNAADCDALIPLTQLDPYDAVRGGMTALPNAVPGASGGLLFNGVNYTDGGLQFLALNSGPGLHIEGEQLEPAIKLVGGTDSTFALSAYLTPAGIATRSYIEANQVQLKGTAAAATSGKPWALDSNGAVFDSTAISSAIAIATAVWAAATRSLTSFNPTTIANPFIATKDLAAIPTASAHQVEWTIVDRLGNAVSLSGKTVRCVFGLVTDAGDVDDTTDDTLSASFSYETSGSGIVVSGTGNNIVTLTHDVTKTATAGAYKYWLWNITDKRLLAKGRAPIEPACQAV